MKWKERMKEIQQQIDKYYDLMLDVLFDTEWTYLPDGTTVGDEVHTREFQRLEKAIESLESMKLEAKKENLKDAILNGERLKRNFRN